MMDKNSAPNVSNGGRFNEKTLKPPATNGAPQV